MRYLLLIYSQERAEGPPPDEIQSIMEAHGAVMSETARKGILLGVERLQPTTTATSIRARDGAAMITDGPFAETREQLAGFYLLECADLDEAIEWAKRIPTSCKGGEGCIEIRPVAELRKPESLRP